MILYLCTGESPRGEPGAEGGAASESQGPGAHQGVLKGVALTTLGGTIPGGQSYANGSPGHREHHVVSSESLTEDPNQGGREDSGRGGR